MFHQTKFTSKQKLGNDLHSTGMQFKGGIPNTRKRILSQRKKFLSPSVNILIRLKVKIRIIKFVVTIIYLTCDISAARQYMFFVLQYTVTTQHDFIAMETRLGCHKYKPDSVILVTTQWRLALQQGFFAKEINEVAIHRHKPTPVMQFELSAAYTC